MPRRSQDVSEQSDALASDDPRSESGITGSRVDDEKYCKFLLAALGVVPGVGPLFGAAASIWSTAAQEHENEVTREYRRMMESRVRDLTLSLEAITQSFDVAGEDVTARINDESYLSLVRAGYRTWDKAESKTKRELVQGVLAHAGVTRICSDDVVRMFIEWIDRYHELLFRVSRSIYQHEATIRWDIWSEIHGESVREDSAEADLFSALIRDLSTGGIIRQVREKTPSGEFVVQRPGMRRRTTRKRVAKSRFSNDEPYELTELGTQFVLYAMDDVAPRIGAGTCEDGS